MIEAIEELERFKAEMVEQLEGYIFEQAGIMLKMIKNIFAESDAIEQTTMKKFKKLMSGKSAGGNPFSQANELLIDVDDFQEAQLSEYSGTPTKNQCDRYSDLRGSRRGSNSENGGSKNSK